MGLLTGLLTLPLAPVRGVGWLTAQITGIAEDDVYDMTRIRAELQGLAVALDTGAISEEEFERGHRDRHQPARPGRRLAAQQDRGAARCGGAGAPAARGRAGRATARAGRG
jgi:hypothetical protein